MRPIISIVARCLACLLASNAWASGLVITSPADGSTVVQGSVLTVSVVNTNSQIHSVILAGNLLDNASTVTTDQSSMTFQVPISQFKRPGRYHLAALDALAQTLQSGTSVSSPITIIVLPRISVAAIQVEPRQLTLRYIGDSYNLRLIGSAGDQNVDLTQSPDTTYQTSDQNIATVNGRGRVVGVGPGSTAITITYRTLTAVLPVMVSSTQVRGDLDANGIVDSNDLRRLQTWLNTPANGPNDARDLNHDGKIDALDARILTTLCTFPRCATHP